MKILKVLLTSTEASTEPLLALVSTGASGSVAEHSSSPHITGPPPSKEASRKPLLEPLLGTLLVRAQPPALTPLRFLLPRLAALLLLLSASSGARLSASEFAPAVTRELNFGGRGATALALLRR